MVEKFQNDEAGYLAWVQEHPDGFVANVDEPQAAAQYPMVHRATHKLLSSPSLTNYTTGRYFKACSTDLQALEAWTRQTYGRALTRCQQCM